MVDGGVDMASDWARPVVHFEIRAKDPDLVSRFYAELFSWDIGQGFIRAIPAGIGGPENGIAGHISTSSEPGVTIYVQVKDLASSAARAIELGGSVTFERMDIPNGPSLAGIRDPEGNLVTLVQQ